MKIIKLELLLVLFSFTIPSIGHSQVKKTYPDGSIKIVLDTLNQMMEGDFKYYYPNGKLKVSGSFVENQKNADWNFYTPKGALLFTRNYQNNFDFDSSENIPKLNREGFNYWHINDYDISYSDIFLSLIYNNQFNTPLYRNDFLLKKIEEYLKSDTPALYDDDRFSNTISVDQALQSLQTKNEIYFAFKEMVFYDLEYQILNRRVIAILPVTIENNIITPLFSIYEPNFREYFENDEVISILFNNRYYGDVIKIYDKNSTDFNSISVSPTFTREKISWFEIKRPFDLEVFYLEKEVNNNFRMYFEPELFISRRDSLFQINTKMSQPKYKIKL